MKIHFKNGSKLEVDKEVVKVIRDKMLEGCGTFQSFSESTDENIFLIVNISEINYIS